MSIIMSLFQNIRRFIAAPATAMLLTACAIEEIDRIIDEKGVTYCSTGADSESSTQGSSSTDTDSSSTGFASDDTGDESTQHSETGTSSTNSDETLTDSSTGIDAVCGNGIVEAGEDCDDDSTYCNAACIKSRFVFVTSDPPLLGAIDGLVGADYECRHRAAVMNFPNAERYRAWISTSTVDARDRVEHHIGRYILVNGLVVAENWDEFASDTHQNPINVTEQSQTHPTAVWTGTQPNGTRAPGTSHCQDWTSSSSLETAYVGDSNTLDASWTQDQLLNPFKCGNAFSLYCIEQP